jgi:para-aminobenzoate synthetase component 1
VRERNCHLFATEPVEVLSGSGKEAIAELDDRPPGWWAAYFTYEWGHNFERISDQRNDSVALPEVTLVRFARVRRVVLPPRRLEPRGSPEPLAWASSIDQKSFSEKVEAVHQLIRDGVCYQINLTRRLSVSHRIDPRTLFEALESINRSPRSFMLWLGETAVVSASPERFLYRNGSHVETSPIKGTGTSRRALLASTKDRAENVMIVDLARNDLGRICQPGSISVPALCVPELYPGVVHLVSTVAGTLKPDIDSDEMLQALFPPASITGAPKASVMQAIVDLEPVPRGIYCGAIGWIDTEHDRAALGVAIRTFTVGPDTTTLGVGAGITIDSDPAAEWRETELKARKLVQAAEHASAD